MDAGVHLSDDSDENHMHYRRMCENGDGLNSWNSARLSEQRNEDDSGVIYSRALPEGTYGRWLHQEDREQGRSSGYLSASRSAEAMEWHHDPGRRGVDQHEGFNRQRYQRGGEREGGYEREGTFERYGDPLVPHLLMTHPSARYIQRVDGNCEQMQLRVKLFTLNHKVRGFMQLSDEFMELPLFEQEAPVDDANGSRDGCNDSNGGRWRSIESFMVAHYKTFEELMDYLREENLEAHTSSAVQVLNILKNLLDAQMFAVFSIRKRVHNHGCLVNGSRQPTEAPLMAANFCIKTHRALLLVCVCVCVLQ